MKLTLGCLLCLVGIAAGLYFGIWWAFIGGIVAVIEEIRADELEAMNVALGVARVMFAGLIGWVCGVIALFPGLVLIKSA